MCGLSFGGAVEQVMNLVVLPLSAHPAPGPYKLCTLIVGSVSHMFLIGLPISFKRPLLREVDLCPLSAFDTFGG